MLWRISGLSSTIKMFAGINFPGALPELKKLTYANVRVITHYLGRLSYSLLCYQIFAAPPRAAPTPLKGRRNTAPSVEGAKPDPKGCVQRVSPCEDS